VIDSFGQELKVGDEISNCAVKEDGSVHYEISKIVEIKRGNLTVAVYERKKPIEGDDALKLENFVKKTEEMVRKINGRRYHLTDPKTNEIIKNCVMMKIEGADQK
jgi:hypothetical protein